MDIVNCKDCHNENCKDRGVNLRTTCWAFKKHPRPKTNADRIRSMTDEELATRIKCPKTTPCIHLEDDYPCVNCKLDWLREEVKE